MKLIKHMEAAFVIALGLATAVAVVPEVSTKAHAAQTVVASRTSTIPTVVVVAKRMSAAEKQQSLRDEARLAAATSRSSI